MGTEPEKLPSELLSDKEIVALYVNRLLREHSTIEELLDAVEKIQATQDVIPSQTLSDKSSVMDFIAVVNELGYYINITPKRDQNYHCGISIEKGEKGGYIGRFKSLEDIRTAERNTFSAVIKDAEEMLVKYLSDSNTDDIKKMLKNTEGEFTVSVSQQAVSLLTKLINRSATEE